MLTDFHPLNNVHDDYTIKKGLHQNNRFDTAPFSL